MQIQLRFAESGHSQIFNRIQTAQILMQQIKKTYKIDIDDQKMISKCGNIIKTTQRFTQQQSSNNSNNNNNKLQKTYVIPDNANENTSKMNQIVCLYLFNEKNLLRSNDDLLSKQKNDSYWIGILRDRCKTFDALRENYYQLKPLNEAVNVQDYKLLQKCKIDLVTLSNQLHLQYKKITDEAETFKQIKLQNDELIHLCENQRKASGTLNKNLIYMENKVKKRLSQLVRASEKNKHQNQELLKENSSFFNSRKRIQDNYGNYWNKIDEIKKNINQLDQKVKQVKKMAKQKFKFSENISMQIDTSNSQNITQIEKIQQTAKNQYGQFIQEIINLLEYQLQQNQCLEKYNKWIQKKDTILSYEKFQGNALKKIQRNFIDLCNLNYKNQHHIKKLYSLYDEILRDIVSKESQIKKLEKQTQKHAINIHSAEKSIIKVEEQWQKLTRIEIQRRINFNKKLKNILNYTNCICLSQTEQRYKFSDEIIKLGEHKNITHELNPLLKCIQIPRIQIQFGNSTDEHLIEQHKQFFDDFIETDRIVFESQINSQMSTIQSQLRDFISEKPSLPIKIKNMQTILEKSSQIFYHMSLRKIQQLKFNYESMKQTLQNQIFQLKQLLEKQKLNHQQDRQNIQSKSKQVVRLNKTVIQKLQLEICKLAGELAKLQEGKSENNMKEMKVSELLEGQRSKNEKLMKDIYELKKKIKQQLTCNETLYMQLIQSKNIRDQLEIIVQDLKITLGQKEINFINLQQKIKKKENQYNNNEDDSINGSEQSMNSKEIDEMKHENLILNEEIQRLNEQLNKIIMKDTEEIEIQVGGMQANETHLQTIHHQKNNKITIGFGNIQIGQTYIFLPFSSDKYVAVTLKQPVQNTLCTMSKLHKNYFLDLKKFNKITRQLLNQCSLVLAVKVTSIDIGQFGLVHGKIQYAMGFQDDDPTIKNYSPYLQDSI